MPQPTKKELIDHVESLVAKCAELTSERDEARKRFCEISLKIGTVFRRLGDNIVEVTTPEEYAEIKGWDCFKEN